MGLPWVRLDTDIFDHPKFLALQEAGEYRAIVLHLKAMVYTGKHELAGFVPELCIPMLTDAHAMLNGDAQHDIKVLLDACLWNAQPGGYSMHGWEDRQFVSDEAKARSAKARAAAKARWAKHNGKDSDAQHAR
jgi:hypothetical protein